MEVCISGALPDQKVEYCSASPGIDLGAESAEALQKSNCTTGRNLPTL